MMHPPATAPYRSIAHTLPPDRMWQRDHARWAEFLVLFLRFFLFARWWDRARLWQPASARADGGASAAASAQSPTEQPAKREERLGQKQGRWRQRCGTESGQNTSTEGARWAPAAQRLACSDPCPHLCPHLCPHPCSHLCPHLCSHLQRSASCASQLRLSVSSSVWRCEQRELEGEGGEGGERAGERSKSRDGPASRRAAAPAARTRAKRTRRSRRRCGTQRRERRTARRRAGARPLSLVWSAPVLQSEHQRGAEQRPLGFKTKSRLRCNARRKHRGTGSSRRSPAAHPR